jgi:hypothetical protein
MLKGCSLQRQFMGSAAYRTALSVDALNALFAAWVATAGHKLPEGDN